MQSHSSYMMDQKTLTEISCKMCTRYDPGYDDDGYQTRGQCQLKFPPWLNVNQTVHETDTCDFAMLKDEQS